MKIITRFLSLSFHEKLILFKILLFLIRTELIFKFMPYSISRKLIFSEKDLPSTTQVIQIDCLYRYVRLLRILCNHLPWKPTCLRIAVSLRDTLRTEGISSVIKFGVCHEEDQLLAHAWLECCGIELLKNGTYNELNINGG
jgi:hypothetical protein